MITYYQPENLPVVPRVIAITTAVCLVYLNTVTNVMAKLCKCFVYDRQSERSRMRLSAPERWANSTTLERQTDMNTDCVY